MRKTSVVAVTGATLLMAGGIGLATSSAEPSGGQTQAGQAAAMDRPVGQKQAARIADRTIERRTGRSARVTGASAENDFGARWEVEVTLDNGREFDVYVNARGKVVKVMKKGRGGSNTLTAGARQATDSASLDWMAAGTAAQDAVQVETGQPAQVTGLEREDDGEALWEVELEGTDGATEFEVLLDAEGNVLEIETEEAGGDHEDGDDSDRDGDREDYDQDREGDDR